MLRDGNRHIYSALDSFNTEKSSPGAFIGGTSNARGDHDGTSDPTTLFTVTGDVIARVYGVCTTSITGAATIEVGLTGNTAELIAQVADATDIDAADIWLDATVDDVRGAVFGDVKASTLIIDGSDIIETIGTANITAGEIYYVCLWRPITVGGKVIAA